MEAGLQLFCSTETRTLSLGPSSAPFLEALTMGAPTVTQGRHGWRCSQPISSGFRFVARRATARPAEGSQ